MTSVPFQQFGKHQMPCIIVVVLFQISRMIPVYCTVPELYAIQWESLYLLKHTKKKEKPWVNGWSPQDRNINDILVNSE